MGSCVFSVDLAVWVVADDLEATANGYDEDIACSALVACAGVAQVAVTGGDRIYAEGAGRSTFDTFLLSYFSSHPFISLGGASHPVVNLFASPLPSSGNGEVARTLRSSVEMSRLWDFCDRLNHADPLDGYGCRYIRC